MHRCTCFLRAALACAGVAAPLAAVEPPIATPTAADLLAAGLPAAERTLVEEVLARNPVIAAARQRAAAAAARAPQAAALPDPEVSFSLFALPPETRVGAQRLSAGIHQTFPGRGKRPLREQAALHGAAAARAEVAAAELDLLTEARRLAYELAFLEAQEDVVDAERGALVRYEKAAQARYASGVGLQQEIVRIQAQITRIDTGLLEIAERRASLLAAVNALRDRPAAEPLGLPALPDPALPELDGEQLREQARTRRPELAAAAARIARHQALVDLAEKTVRPDLTVGLSYTVVERRDDAAGRAAPPPDDGDDVLALTGSITLPVRRRPRAAAIDESLALRREVEAGERQAVAAIERAIGDLTTRMPMLFEHWQLLATVLRVQAREALRSAETAYSTGKLNALDLLDAEVVLLEVQIAAWRARADFAVARAQLERAIAHPLPPSPGDPTS